MLFKEIKADNFIHIAKLSYYGKPSHNYDKIEYEFGAHKAGFRRNLMGKLSFTVIFTKDDAPVWMTEIYENFDVYCYSYDKFFAFQPVSNQMEIFEYVKNLIIE